MRLPYNGQSHAQKIADVVGQALRLLSKRRDELVSSH